MKKLVCDLDDVICDNKIIELFNQYMGTNYTFDEIPEGYDFAPILNNPQKEREVSEFLINQNFYKDATLKPDCFRVLKKLQEEFGYDIHVCSACLMKGCEDISGIIFKQKYDFITKQLPFIKPHNIILTNSKDRVFGDVMIDDRISNLNGQFTTKLLFDCWYNRDVEIKDSNIIRVKSWLDIENILTSK